MSLMSIFIVTLCQRRGRYAYQDAGVLGPGEASVSGAMEFILNWKNSPAGDELSQGVFYQCSAATPRAISSTSAAEARGSLKLVS